MVQKVTAKAQLAIGLAAMAATMTVIAPAPAKGKTLLEDRPPAAGLFGSLHKPEPRTSRTFDTF